MKIRPSSKFNKYSFFYFIIALSLTIFFALNGRGLEFVDTRYNILFGGIQLGVIVILFYMYFDSIESFEEKKNDIGISADEVIFKNIDPQIIDGLNKNAIKTVRSARSLWLTLIVSWLLLYVFILSYGLGFIEVPAKTKDLLLRLYNHVDTIQVFFLYSLFSSSKPKINLKSVIKKNNAILLVITLLCVIDLATFFFFPSITFDRIHSTLGALLCATAFLMFFSRLDSIFIQFNKLFLGILMIYGISQFYYPSFFSNYQEEGPVYASIYVIGIGASVIGKLSLGLIFTKIKYLKRLVYFFYSIYYLGPISAKRLSVVHSFYTK